jgi:hypothetical protein
MLAQELRTLNDSVAEFAEFDNQVLIEVTQYIAADIEVKFLEKLASLSDVQADAYLSCSAKRSFWTRTPKKTIAPLIGTVLRTSTVP